MSWQKYTKNKGLNLGIDKFGESAHTKRFINILIYQRKILQIFIQKKMRE